MRPLIKTTVAETEERNKRMSDKMAVPVKIKVKYPRKG